MTFYSCWLFQGAQKVIDYLRANNLGRAKMIVLEKIRDAATAQMAKPFEAPEGVSRLFDLVKPADDNMR
jgi:chromosome segregation ATPase